MSKLSLGVHAGGTVRFTVVSKSTKPAGRNHVGLRFAAVPGAVNDYARIPNRTDSPSISATIFLAFVSLKQILKVQSRPA